MLYKFEGVAWQDAEHAVDEFRLAQADGVEYFLEWVKEKYLPFEVANISDSMGSFFKVLKRLPSGDVRTYVNQFEVDYAKLESCGVILPDVVKAWFLLDKALLSQERRSNLLTAAGNEYKFAFIRKAMLLNCGDVGRHETRTHLRPQQQPPRFGQRNPSGRQPFKRKPHGVHITDSAPTGDAELPSDMEQMAETLWSEDEPDKGQMSQDDVPVPEEVFEMEHEAYAMIATARQKLSEAKKARGFFAPGSGNPSSMSRDNRRENGHNSHLTIRKGGQDHEGRLREMKKKSLCKECGQQGHWHKDPECPKNNPASSYLAESGGESMHSVGASSLGSKLVYALLRGETEKPKRIIAETRGRGVADTACARPVMGRRWFEFFRQDVAEQGIFRYK